MKFKASPHKLSLVLPVFLLAAISACSQNISGGGNLSRSAFQGMQSVGDSNRQPASVKDTTNARDREIKRFRYRDSIQYYKVINYRGDTTYVDTTNTVAAFNRMNQRRKDDFGYMPLPTGGEGYTPLVFEQKKGLAPDFGHTGRAIYYHTEEDIKYYDVKTPFSEIAYYSYVFASNAGQMLDFNFAVNPVSNWNVAAGYRGMKIRGAYSSAELASNHGRLFLSSNFHTRNNKYRAKAHITFQFLSNNENGGLTEEGIQNFLSGAPEFALRSTLPTNFSTSTSGRNVSNRLGGTRLYLEHSYDLLNSAVENPDKFRISLLNEIKFENKAYKYTDPAFFSSPGAPSENAKKDRDYYGSDMSYLAFTYDDVNTSNGQITTVRDTLMAKTDSTRYRSFNINAGLGLHIPLVNLYAEGKISYSHHNYSSPYYRSTINYAAEHGLTLPQRPEIGGSTTALLLHGKINPIKYFGAEADFNYNFAGLWKDARELRLSAYLQLNEDNRLSGSYLNASYYPQITSLLYASNYKNFNWDNDFERLGYNEIKVDLHSKKIIDAGASFISIQNYVYYDYDRLPRQTGEGVNILSVYLARDLRIKSFGLDVRAQYQNVTGGSSFLPLPMFVGRLNVYFQWNMFRKALNVIGGVTLNYFTAFEARAYNPLLSDYNLQDPANTHSIGNFPFTDVYLALKIRRTRIYLRYENLSSYFGGKNYFSSPNMPYIDATVRFGIVWDWFN